MGDRGPWCYVPGTKDSYYIGRQGWDYCTVPYCEGEDKGKENQDMYYCEFWPAPSGGLTSATSATSATGSCWMEVTAGRTRRLGTAQVELQCRAGIARWRIWRRIASPLTPRVVLSTSLGLGYRRARWATTPRSFGQHRAGLDVEGVEDTLFAIIWVAT